MQLLIFCSRVQQLLRLSYAHVQMMLYRPFLHYVSDKACVGKQIDERAYACAAACVSVSRNIVHITTEMKKRGLLVGAYWFTVRILHAFLFGKSSHSLEVVGFSPNFQDLFY